MGTQIENPDMSSPRRFPPPWRIEEHNEACFNLGLANSGDLTLNQFFTIRDDPNDGNNPDQYAAAAGKQFGVNPATFQMQQFTV
jgi:hypothetical protein